MAEKVDTISFDHRIAALAAAQHGVVSRSQLLDLGVSRGWIDGRLERGLLHHIQRGVYAIGHPLVATRGRALAAVLACGEGAVLSHKTAADLWGVRPSASPSIDVTVPSVAGRAKRAGVVVHRVPALPAGQATRREGIPVTTPARTLLDLAAVVPRSALARAIDQAERLRLFDLGAVEAVLRTSAGRPGSRALVSALGLYRPEPALTRSELEERFLRLCRRKALPRPAVNVGVAGHEVDFLWRQARLIVETDGREGHGTRAAFERDRARDAELTLLGYRVVRLTYRRVVRDPEGVAQLLTKLLAAQPFSISSTR